MQAPNPLRCLRPILLLTLLASACAGKSPGAAGPKADAKSARPWPGEPAPRVASLAAAVGGDEVLALALIHADAWPGLRRQLEPIESFSYVLSREPWLSSDDPWQPLQLALQLRKPRAPALPALAGWDRTRPVAIGWLANPTRSLLQELSAGLFEHQRLPIHIRVVIPATNAGALAEALAKALATLPGKSFPGGRFVLQYDHDGRLAVAVISGEDYARLDLLYFSYHQADPSTDADLVDQLEAATRSPRQRNTADPISRLLANGRGVAVTVRPAAIAQRFLLEMPRNIDAALMGVDPSYKPGMRVAGTRELLAGYLVTSAGQPEIAEIALAANFDRGVDVVTLARLTPAGQRQMSAIFRADARTIATSPDALFSATVALPSNGKATQVEPLFSPAFRAESLQEVMRVVQEGGTPGWLGLLARPMAFWRSGREDKQLSNELHLPAAWPSEASFELLNYDHDGRIAFRVRGRLPKGETANWLSLAKQFAGMLGQNANLQEDARPDGTWITWQQDLTSESKTNLPAGPASLEPVHEGTFAVLRLAGAALADRFAGKDTEYRSRSDRELLQLLRLVGRAESRTRWQNGWLIGETRAGMTEASALPPYEPALPKLSAAAPTEATAGRLALERAVVQLRRLLNALTSIEPKMRVPMLRQHQVDVKRELAQARREDGTINDAMAVDWMLLQIAKEFEVQAAWEASHPEPERKTSDDREGQDAEMDGASPNPPRELATPPRPPRNAPRPKRGR
jgi:hypothetical protein